MEHAPDVNIYFILFAGTAGMFLLATGIILFVVIYQRRLIRHRQKMQELQLVQQQELLYTHIQAQEAERSRVAADLHDEVGATLAALRLSLADIANAPAADSKNEMFLKTRMLTDKAIGSIRSISHGITPSGLEIFGLAPVLDELADSLSTAAVEVSFTASGNITRQPVHKELALYRVAQEMMNNALKHSGASEVLLELMEDENAMMLVCSDNGCGFDMEMSRAKGMGLKNIGSRMKMIEGDVSIRSVKGEGTRITVTLPLKNNRHGS